MRGARNKDRLPVWHRDREFYGRLVPPVWGHTHGLSITELLIRVQEP